jgi:hypothetical protein
LNISTSLHFPYASIMKITIDLILYTRWNNDMASLLPMDTIDS